MKPTYTIGDILGSRSRIAVLRVLHGIAVPLNASQIAARTSLTRPAVASVLSDFARMGIVLSSPAGRASVHWINRENVYVENLIDPLLLAEHDLPANLTDDLAWTFQDDAVSVVLFGSYARGDQTPASDVDVALVAEDAVGKDKLDALAVDHSVEFRNRFGASLSAITYTVTEAAALYRTSPELAQSIAREGVVVSGLRPWEWGDDGEE